LAVFYSSLSRRREAAPPYRREEPRLKRQDEDAVSASPRYLEETASFLASSVSKSFVFS
jgi:hypothetical protein